MVFIVDENITPAATSFLKAHDLEAYHVNELKSSKRQRIVDDQLRKLSIQKGYILITKDDDFVKSYVDRKVPNRLVFIYGGKDKSQDLAYVKEVAPFLETYLKAHDFIEVGPKGIRFPFSD